MYPIPLEGTDQCGHLTSGAIYQPDPHLTHCSTTCTRSRRAARTVILWDRRDVAAAGRIGFSQGRLTDPHVQRRPRHPQTPCRPVVAHNAAMRVGVLEGPAGMICHQLLYRAGAGRDLKKGVTSGVAATSELLTGPGRYSKPSSSNPMAYWTMTPGVTCGMSGLFWSGPTFASRTAARNRSVETTEFQAGSAGCK